jgi:hypothetical protein
LLVLARASPKCLVPPASQVQDGFPLQDLRILTAVTTPASRSLRLYARLYAQFARLACGELRQSCCLCWILSTLRCSMHEDLRWLEAQVVRREHIRVLLFDVHCKWGCQSV